MTPAEELRKEFEEETSLPHISYDITDYSLWLESKLIQAEASTQFDHLIGEAIKDCCPKCGSDDIVVTIYCNECKEAH